MGEINYIGEQLWVGLLGHLMIVLAFCAVLYSAYAYHRHTRSTDQSWKRIGRLGFYIHGIAIFLVIGLIFFAMFNKMYEYIYVYRTVSDDLPMHYLLAAFWEDQEGSFLLWMFWHIVLGFILIKKAGSWEAPVMVTLALIQAFIGSMLLGIYLPFTTEELKLGSNPFALIRDVFEGPIFANADYLTLVTGQGLNPLLQNYWMTIHPPTLFLGFASVSVPFCFAVAGLSNGRHKEVLPVVLKWSLFSAFILGLGILMGGAWAYEALTFGGYWAWDPVENTSLVPWLVLIAGIHTNLIAKSTGYAVKSTYTYYLLSFILILYSTFLTRSGILGETSVHAFTTLGLETQLIAFIAFFVLLGGYKFIKAHSTIPVKQKEEAIYSREFWMFIGALVLFFSGLLMTVSTSLPVYNEIVSLFNENHISKAIDDPMHHHNKYQIWIGIFIGLLTGSAILLRYKGANWHGYRVRFVRYFGTSLIISLALTLILQGTLRTTAWQQYIFLFAGIFAITANAHYVVSFLKGNLKSAGSVISHGGFGILILGIMYSGLNKETISTNPFFTKDIMDENAVNKAVVLIKGQPFFTNEYWVNYKGDSLAGNLRTYEIEFRKVDKNNETLETFTTRPSAIYSNDYTKIEATNPGTEHKLHYDVFTMAFPPAHLQDIEVAQQLEDSLKYLSYQMQIGEVFNEESYTIELHPLAFDIDLEESQHSEGQSQDYDLTIGLPMTIVAKRTGEEYRVMPGLGLKDALIYQFPKVINDLGIKIKVPESVFTTIFTEEDELEYETITLKERESVAWSDKTITLMGFDRNPEHKNYTPQENDIALAALLRVQGNNEITDLNPVFIIRNGQQLGIKDYDPGTGLHSRFTQIDPLTETMTFELAFDQRAQNAYEVLIASDVPRSDILIMEANIFPGINLVWLGCLMMLGGLLMSLIAKRQSN